MVPPENVKHALRDRFSDTLMDNISFGCGNSLLFSNVDHSMPSKYKYTHQIVIASQPYTRQQLQMETQRDTRDFGSFFNQGSNLCSQIQTVFSPKLKFTDSQVETNEKSHLQLESDVSPPSEDQQHHPSPLPNAYQIRDNQEDFNAYQKQMESSFSADDYQLRSQAYQIGLPQLISDKSQTQEMSAIYDFIQGQGRNDFSRLECQSQGCSDSFSSKFQVGPPNSDCIFSQRFYSANNAGVTESLQSLTSPVFEQLKQQEYQQHILPLPHFTPHQQQQLMPMQPIFHCSPLQEDILPLPHRRTHQQQANLLQNSHCNSIQEDMLPASHLTDSQLPNSHQTDSQLPHSHQTDSQLPHSHQTYSQLPNSHQTYSQLPNSHQTDYQPPNSHQTDYQPPNSHQTYSQLPNSHQTDCQLPNSHLTDCQLPISHVTDCQLPISHVTDCQLPISHVTDCQSPISHVTNCQLPIFHLTDSQQQISHCRTLQFNDEPFSFNNANEDLVNLNEKGIRGTPSFNWIQNNGYYTNGIQFSQTNVRKLSESQINMIDYAFLNGKEQINFLPFESGDSKKFHDMIKLTKSVINNLTLNHDGQHFKQNLTPKNTKNEYIYIQKVQRNEGNHIQKTINQGKNEVIEEEELTGEIEKMCGEMEQLNGKVEQSSSEIKHLKGEAEEMNDEVQQQKINVEEPNCLQFKQCKFLEIAEIQQQIKSDTDKTKYTSDQIINDSSPIPFSNDQCNQIITSHDCTTTNIDSSSSNVLPKQEYKELSFTLHEPFDQEQGEPPFLGNLRLDQSFLQQNINKNSWGEQICQNQGYQLIVPKKRQFQLSIRIGGELLVSSFLDQPEQQIKTREAHSESEFHHNDLNEDRSFENTSNLTIEQNSCIQKLQMHKKKNVAKNIMTAFKNFIQNPMKFGYLQEQVDTALAQYNETKRIDETLEEMQTKFFKYIIKKKFNHYTIKLLLQHPNYGKVFEFFLRSLSDFWLQQSKVHDLRAHLAMINFLKEAFNDIEIIKELKKYDKRKH